MWWSAAKCPVVARERVWIEQSMRWLVAEFGEDVLRGVVVLPTDDFFPGAYTGSADDVERVFARIRVHMGVDADRVALDYVNDDLHEILAHQPWVAGRFSGSAGEYENRDGHPVIAIRSREARDPMALVATIAHELGHQRLLGEGRVPADRRDHEPLTDLLTVVFGLGIFGANAAAEFTPTRHGWSASHLGYLTEPMFGYALAYYAWLRDEPTPAWSTYLDTNPRTFLKKGLRYLDTHHQQYQ